MPLPLLSRGGTGVVVMLTLIGILVSVARRAVPAELAERADIQSNPFTSDTDFPG
jgi:cell division protein FtsW (lipid II flippase)